MKIAIAVLALFLLFSAVFHPSVQMAAAQSSATPLAISPLATTQLIMHSESGDYVGGGQDYSYTPADGLFFAQAGDNTQDGLVDYVSVIFNGNAPGTFWLLAFSTTQLNSNLAIGIYNKAQRAPFADPGHPGLDVAGNGRGCNQDTGKFIILDAKFDYSVSPPQILSFAAQFEQHCEGSPEALFGTFYYNYTPTVTVSLNQTSATGGQTVTGTVTLPSPAPAGGAKVNLVSTNAALVNVPSSVTIPQGQLSTHFTAAIQPIKARPPVQIVATYAGVSSAVGLTVHYPYATLTQLSLHQDASQFGAAFDRVYKEGLFNSIMAFSPTDTPDFNITSFTNSTEFWTLTFSTQQLGIPFRRGFYPNAQRASFAAPGHPGIDIGGNGSGCNTVAGEFTVLDATFDDTISPPLVVSLGVQFKQLCESRESALTGSLYINYSVPFDMCIQDDGSNNILQINTTTGAYQFSNCGGQTVGGTGTITRKGGSITLQQGMGDHRVLAKIDTATKKATATIQILSTGRTFSITDRDITNNTCACK